jgi:DNA polymerase-1
MESIQVKYIKSKVHEYLFDTDRRLGLDIETYPVIKEGVEYSFCSKRSKIRLIQIYDNNSKTSLLIDYKMLSPEEKRIVLDYVATHKFFIHNALFDVRFFQEEGIPFVDCICTMTMYTTVLRAHYSDSKKYSSKLGACVRNLFRVDIDNSEGSSDWSKDELDERQLTYAAHDAYWVYKIGEKLSKDPAVRTDNFRLTTGVLNAICRIIRSGIYIDVQKLNENIKNWENLASAALEECDKYYQGMNVRSGVQLGVWLKKNLTRADLEIWPVTPKGSLKTDAETLTDYGSGVEALKPLLKYKKYQKYLSTYGKSIIELVNPVTGRIHPNYTVAFTESGRLSSRQPNVQNFPRPDAEAGRYRDLFKPQNDKNVLVGADYSQIEVRIAAILSKDKKMLEAYREGKDLYKQTASLILHKKEADITKAERQQAKAVVLGLQFGMGEVTLCSYAKQYGVNMSIQESATMVDNYRAAYSGLTAWQRKTTKQAASTLTSSTVCGLVRKLDSHNYYTCSLNTPVQGSAAEALIYAITLLDKEFIFNKIPARIVATVHDEILVECRKEVAEEVKVMLEQAMMLGFTYVFPQAYGAENNIVEAHIGESWFDAKD